jgi:hypothetical protein
MNKLSLYSVAMFAAISFETNANTIEFNHGSLDCNSNCSGLVGSSDEMFSWSSTNAEQQALIWTDEISYLNTTMTDLYPNFEPLTNYNERQVSHSVTIETHARYWGLRANNSKYSYNPFGVGTWFFGNTFSLGENPISSIPTEISLSDCGTPSSICTWTLIEFSPKYTAPSAVPIPAAAWLFGSALIGLLGIARRKTKA